MRARGNDGTPAASKTKRGPAVPHLSVAERIARGKAARDQLDALELLTHVPGEPYEVYVRRIVQAPGPAGRLARIVKLADLDDHLAHATNPSDAPPYAWARKHLLATANGVSVAGASGESDRESCENAPRTRRSLWATS